MDDVNSRIDNLLYKLTEDALLNDQFQQLIQLQDESNPHFVREVVELFFQDSAIKLDRLQSKLSESPVDYTEVDALVHQFKGSSASFGAQTIAQYCVQLREACLRRDQRTCQTLLEQVKKNYLVLRSQLEIFLQLEQHKKQLMSS